MTLYEILEISPDATVDDIKKAYRDLAKKNHPDHGGNETVFQTIKNAFEILSNSEKRKEYDNSGGIDNFEEKVTATALNLFNAAIKALVGGAYYGSDPYLEIKNQIHVFYNNQRMNFVKQIKNIHKEITARKKILTYILNKPKNDFLNNSINNEIKNGYLGIDQIKEQMKILKSAYKLLLKYKFKEGEGLKMTSMVINGITY
jgi:curved DNA-binding protein CbpA